MIKVFSRGKRNEKSFKTSLSFVALSDTFHTNKVENSTDTA